MYCTNVSICMKIFVINLDDETERMAAVDSQLCNFGLQYFRISAVDARKQSEAWLTASVNHFRWWCIVGRPIRIGEIGCAMSHYAIYKKMQQDDLKVACVLEDDVILDEKFSAALEFVERNADASRPQVFLLSNHTTGVIDDNADCHIVACRSDMYTEGYVITRTAAKALLGANIPMQTPCDWWGRWVKQRIIELYHVFPTVCRQDQTQYVSGTVDANSFNVKNLSLPRFCLHKTLRVVGKLIDLTLTLWQKFMLSGRKSQ